MDSFDTSEPFTSKLAIYPQLESLVNSSFCKPFLKPLDEDFASKIFPDHVSVFGLTQGMDCIKTVIMKKKQKTSLEAVVEQLEKMLDGYIHYYTQFPEDSHFLPYSGEEIATLAQHLKKKIREISGTFNQISTDDVESDPDLRNLIEIFPNHNRDTLKSYLEDFAARQNGDVIDVDELINEILMKDSGEETEEQPARKKECRIFPFYPEENNDTNQSRAVHKYVASSFFYKMASIQGPHTARSVVEPHKAIQSIEYIENDVTTQRFEECKSRFKGFKEGEREELLFHGTDSTNIESIFNNNFDLGMAPANRPKAMAFGRGIYMSEYPAVCLGYGNVLVLCRVLLGRVVRVDALSGRQEMSSEHDSKEVCLEGGDKVSMRVIKTVDQVLPYCVINLKQNNSAPTSLRLVPFNLLASQPSPLPPYPGRSLVLPATTAAWNIQSSAAPPPAPPPAPVPPPQGLLPPPAHHINTVSPIHPIFSSFPGWVPPNTRLAQVLAAAPTSLTWQSKIFGPTVAQQSAPGTSNPSGAGQLSATITSRGGGGVVPAPAPAPAGVVQVLLGASQLGSGLSNEKRREMKERMKRLSKNVKELEEQLTSVDINNLPKLKKLLEIVKQVEANNNREFDEITIQKCEKAVKKFLLKSQQEKP